MKRIICLIMAAVTCALLCACAANPKCEFDAAIAELSEAEYVYTYVYADEKGYSVESGEALAEMLAGEWTKASRPAEMNKAVSFTIGTQYEICLFEGESAIIYCGYAGVLESDRQYYSCKLTTDVNDICEYLRANGEEVVIEE